MRYIYVSFLCLRMTAAAYRIGLVISIKMGSDDTVMSAITQSCQGITSINLGVTFDTHPRFDKHFPNVVRTSFFQYIVFNLSRP